MFEVRAEKARLQVERREVLTSGSVNAYRVRFTFSREWEGLERRAVFRAGDESRTLPLDGSGECAIPWEVLARPGLYVQAGVYGVGAGETVLPTVWANLGAVLEGAAPGEEARPPTPALWEELLAGKADSLDYTPEGNIEAAGPLFRGEAALRRGAAGRSGRRLGPRRAGRTGRPPAAPCCIHCRTAGGAAAYPGAGGGADK